MNKLSSRAKILLAVLLAALAVAGIGLALRARGVGTILADGKLVVDHELYAPDDESPAFPRGRLLGVVSSGTERRRVYALDENGVYVEAVDSGGKSVVYRRVDELTPARTSDEKGG